MSNDIDKSLEKVLDMNDLSGIESSDSRTPKEIEEEERFKKRLAALEEAKADLKKKRDEGDERYVKDALRRVVEIGLITAETLQSAIETNPQGRDVECISTVLNSITTAAKELQGVEVDKQKIAISKETVEMKKLTTKNATPKLENNSWYGTPGDLLDMMNKGTIIPKE